MQTKTKTTQESVKQQGSVKGILSEFQTNFFL